MTENLQALIALILEGSHARAAAEARRLHEAGVARERIVVAGVEEAMRRLDSKCTLEEFNLLEIMLAGRAATEVVKALFPHGALPGKKGVVVLGTPRGDVHDLGKNVVKSILISSGYKVVDCGKDVPTERFVQAAHREGALAIGVSGLVTTTMASVREIRPGLRKEGLECLIVAGGAALRLCTPDSIGVDHVAKDAFEGVAFINRGVEE
jgi:methanogenic corrinoid protein MtbC1